MKWLKGSKHKIKAKKEKQQPVITMVRRTSEWPTHLSLKECHNVNLYWRGTVGQSCKCRTVTVDNIVRSKDVIQEDRLKQGSKQFNRL